jgi:hypothetical protein
MRVSLRFHTSHTSLFANYLILDALLLHTHTRTYTHLCPETPTWRSGGAEREHQGPPSQILSKIRGLHDPYFVLFSFLTHNLCLISIHLLKFRMLTRMATRMTKISPAISTACHHKLQLLRPRPRPRPRPSPRLLPLPLPPQALSCMPQHTRSSPLYHPTSSPPRPPLHLNQGPPNHPRAQRHPRLTATP